MRREPGSRSGTAGIPSLCERVAKRGLAPDVRLNHADVLAAEKVEREGASSRPPDKVVSLLRARFGAHIYPYFHHHYCVLDEVFALDAAGAMRFYEARSGRPPRAEACSRWK